MTEVNVAISAAIDLILQVPGYHSFGEELSELWRDGKLSFDSTLSDRGTTDWRGNITIGQEAVQGGIVSLAETLVHEQYHRTQPPYAKTLSFWGGIFTSTPVWQRLEKPAYRTAYDFLIALEKYAGEINQVDWVIHAKKEQAIISQVFLTYYGAPLLP